MDDRSLLDKIKSSFILQTIFDYTDDTHIKLKLLNYSKSLQKKINLLLNDYKLIYINNLKLNIKKDYFTLFYDIDDPFYYLEEYIKDLLSKNLEKDLSLYTNLNINNLQDYIINICQNYSNKNDINEYLNHNYLIDIYSPFFTFLSNSKFFENIFTISIPLHFDEKSKNDYISTFNNLNKLNIKYTSLFLYIEEGDDIINIIELNINMHNIKKLYIYFKSYSDIMLFEEAQNYLLNFENLLYLKIKFDKDLIKSNYLEKLNNFKNLQKFSLNGVFFEDYFDLKLYNLKILELRQCKNIALGENNWPNLKILKLYLCELIKPKKPIKFENLENLIIYIPLNSKTLYNKIIDFKSIKLLNNLKIEKSYFIYFDDLLPIEYLELYSNKDLHYSKDLEKKIFEKIINMKTLKTISITINELNNDEIFNIPGENQSITNLHFKYDNKIDKCDFSIIQDKFPNLIDLTINNNKTNINKSSKIEIKENKAYNVNKITLISGNINLFIHSFYDLIEIKLILRNELSNIKDIFPIFEDNCNVIFNNLNTFEFTYPKINLEIFNNIYKNLDKMPILKNCLFSFKIFDLNKDFYEKFIEKLLSFKLINLHLYISNSLNNYSIAQYSKDEIKKMIPKWEHLKLNNILINKLK